jgi:hypothetical protein
MATAQHTGTVTDRRGFTMVGDPAYHAYLILYVGFAVLPIVAGVDKFFDVLTGWDTYLAPIVPQTLQISPHTFMMIVGVIEIVAGLLVAWRPRWAAYIVAAWLAGIIANLFVLSAQTGTPAYDVALRDFGLLLGALALGRISAMFSVRPLGF